MIKLVKLESTKTIDIGRVPEEEIDRLRRLGASGTSPRPDQRVLRPPVRYRSLNLGLQGRSKRNSKLRRALAASRPTNGASLWFDEGVFNLRSIQEAVR
ncbi:hypothetical protein D3C80_1882800 [compost metagenome]